MEDPSASALPCVLVVDDETTIAHAIRMILEAQGCEVHAAHTGEDGIALLEGRTFDVALLDIVLPGMNGIGVLTEIKRRSPETQVIMMTSHASTETAIQAIRRGAYDYLHKPFEDIEDVWNQVKRALEKRQLTEQNRILLEKHVALNAKFADAVMRLSALIEIGQVMSGFQSLDELLELFTGLVEEHMGCARVALHSVEPHGLRLLTAHGFEASDAVLASGSSAPSLQGRAADAGVPRRMDEGSEGPREAWLGDVPPCVSVPIQSWRQVIGVLSVSARRSGEPYTAEDVNYLSGLAGQVAIGIDRIRRMEEERAARDGGAPAHRRAA